MNDFTQSFEQGFHSFVDFLPRVVLGLLLILVAWIVAGVVGKAVAKGLKAVGFSNRLTKWGVTQSEEQGNSTVDTLGQVAYYLVWVLFLPGIFSTFGLDAISQPFSNMIHVALGFIPNIIAAVVVLVLGVVAARFVKNLVYNLGLAANVDKHLEKFSGSETDPAEAEAKKDTLASALSSVVYFVILIPIILVALEILNINTIAEPISSVLSTILHAIPNILVAVILLAVGFVLAKLVGDVLTDLLRGAGVNKYSSYLKNTGNLDLDLAKISGQLISGLIALFFLVEALNALQLTMLNLVGAAIIAYVPNVLSAALIIGLGFIGGQVLASGIKKVTNSPFAGVLVKYILIVFAVFMALDQLQFASDIVQTAFIFIIGGLAVAFALAFGIGGRDFAAKQLERANKKIDKESAKAENAPEKNDPSV